MQRKPISVPVLIFFLLSLCLPIQIAPVFAQDKHFLWRIQPDDRLGSGRSGSTRSAFVLGSIHMMKQEHYPLSRIIENAFEQSDTLVVEANVNEADPELLKRVMADAFYPPGDSLEKHVSPEIAALTKKRAEEMGLDFQFISRQKPWFLVLTLPSMALLKAGYDPRCGIDMHFLGRAKGKKKIIELESLEFQMRLLSGFSGAEQELLLLYTLEDLNIAAAEADSLVAAWQVGDTRTVEELTARSFKGDPRLESVAGSLISERNRTMADKIEEIVKTEKSCFFVVGAAHLVGKTGIFEILKARGWRVDQL